MYLYVYSFSLSALSRLSALDRVSLSGAAGRGRARAPGERRARAVWRLGLGLAGPRARRSRGVCLL